MFRCWGESCFKSPVDPVTPLRGAVDREDEDRSNWTQGADGFWPRLADVNSKRSRMWTFTFGYFWWFSIIFYPHRSYMNFKCFSKIQMSPVWDVLRWRPYLWSSSHRMFARPLLLKQHDLVSLDVRSLRPVWSLAGRAWSGVPVVPSVPLHQSGGKEHELQRSWLWVGSRSAVRSAWDFKFQASHWASFRIRRLKSPHSLLW